MKNFNLTLRGMWDDVQSSLWFRPGIIAFLAILLAIITPYIDQNTKLKFYAIGADNARAVLTTIASSMLTVVTLTFSILMVALTLTSQQFSPRVLRSFTSNHTAQNILGILIGAFLYSLLVLVTVINTSDTTFVPLLSVLIAILYALVGIGAFIYFIDHIAKSIRVSYIIHTINAETIALLHNETFREKIAGYPKHMSMSDPLLNQHDAVRVNAHHAGYIQAIDWQRLSKLADHHNFVVQIVGMTGDFVAQERPLLYIWPQSLQGDADKEAPVTGENSDPGTDSAHNEDTKPNKEGNFEIPKHLIGEFVQQFDIGVERTMFEDVLFGLRQLVDIALKALSPGVNDPTTAVNCLHYLENILIQAVKYPDKQVSYYNESGRLCLIGRTVTFAAMLDLTFTQLRYYGCTDPTVAEQMLMILSHLVEETEDTERHNQIWQHAELLYEQIVNNKIQQYNQDIINNYLFQLANRLDRQFDYT